ncbi:MAG: cupin domain-containing protein, partial [Blautia sp.]|nr:cupin domain-containing protein [Blautia sp.]
MKIGLLNKQTEIVDNSTIKHLYFSILELNYSPAHTHKDIEIIQILDGSLHVTTFGEEFDLSAGDVAVINSEEIHTVHSNKITPCRLLLIQINPKMFRSYYPQIEHIRFLSNNIGTQLTDDVLEKFKTLFL